MASLDRSIPQVAAPGTGRPAGDPPAATATMEGASETMAVPLLEEQVHVAKREVVTGRVRVRTVVDATEELVRQELATGHVTVTRVPVGRVVDAPPTIRTEGDVTIIPILEEVLVVEKRLLLKEEVHVRRTVTVESVEQPVTLRTQRVVVEHPEPDDVDG